MPVIVDAPHAGTCALITGMISIIPPEGLGDLRSPE
jgi:hypothetical protein